jgi:hypothetical protein
MSSTPTPHPDSPPESWPGVAAGLALFLIAGWELILNELPYELHQQLFNPSYWFFNPGMHAAAIQRADKAKP